MGAWLHELILAGPQALDSPQALLAGLALIMIAGAARVSSWVGR